MMPEIDGFAVLRDVRSDATLKSLPVIMVAAAHELVAVVRCVEEGADDYLVKPLNPILLRARIERGLDRKRLREQEQSYLTWIESERSRAEELLMNILPGPIAERLKEETGVIADRFDSVTVLFADIRGFTHASEQMDARQVVLMLNEFFTAMSAIIRKHGGVLDKFIGDCVMALFGAPVPDEGAVRQGFEAAVEMQQEVKRINVSRMSQEFPEMRIGIGLHTGPAVVGNIGSADRVQYTAIGDTVNVAARLVDLAAVDQVIVSENVHAALQDCGEFEHLGPVELRGRQGSVNIYSVRWSEQTPAFAGAARHG
jgi:adenylate cyclase